MLSDVNSSTLPLNTENSVGVLLQIGGGGCFTKAALQKEGAGFRQTLDKTCLQLLL